MPNPRRDLSAILEFMADAERGQQGAGGGRTNAGALHEASTAFVFPDYGGNRPIVTQGDFLRGVLGNPLLQLIGMRQ